MPTCTLSAGGSAPISNERQRLRRFNFVGRGEVMIEADIRMDERRRCLKDLESIIRSLEEHTHTLDAEDSLRAAMVARLVESQIREIRGVIQALQNMWSHQYGDSFAKEAESSES